MRLDRENVRRADDIALVHGIVGLDVKDPLEAREIDPCEWHLADEFVGLFGEVGQRAVDPVVHA